MKRFLFPLVALVLGAGLVVLSQFAPNGGTPADPSGDGRQVNANANPDTTNASNTNTPAATDPLPAKVSLDVPFTPQAPTGDWSPEFNDACEEASALMVAKFLRQEPMPNAEATEQLILAIERWETENLGHWESTTAAETERFIEGYWPDLAAEVKPLTSMDQVRSELAAGRPVILPANGRELGNPYFRAPGPPYHMLVVTGYDSKGFITNDPGTRRGEDYRYSAQTLFDATHDWQGHEVADGPKVYLVLTSRS